MKLSYIIPFYNGQDTIHHCLDSILAIGLDLNELEIIIVDDCSPMSAESIVSDYLVKYRNIRIIQHSENKRQGGAKNTGISLAKGKYIAFADQDDTIIANNSKLALDFALHHDVDMLACHYTILHEDKNIREYGIDKGDKQIISGKEFCEQYFATGYNLAPWANLYKRNFLQKVSRPYEENVVMEDADWIAWHWIHANKVGILNIPIYTWVMNPTSITHSQHYINRADWIKYGYRKIYDAQAYQNKSRVFAQIMIEDGRQNIIFLHALTDGAGDVLREQHSAVHGGKELLHGRRIQPLCANAEALQLALEGIGVLKSSTAVVFTGIERFQHLCKTFAALAIHTLFQSQIVVTHFSFPPK